MKRRILSLLLAMVMVLGMLPGTAFAASSEEEALGEVQIFHNGQQMAYLSINGRVREQTYTYYNYVDADGSSRQVPAYCVNPNTAGVPQTVPAGTGISYLANQKYTDPKVFGIVASGYPHRPLDELGLNDVNEGYYATKMALWCHILDNWNINDLTVNPAADQAAAQRVLNAAKSIYETGMYWDHILEPRLTVAADQDTAYPVTVDGEEYLQQLFTVTSETWVDGYATIAFADPSGVPEGTRIVGMQGNDITGVYLTTSDGNGGWTGQFKVLYPKESVEGETGSVQVKLSAKVHKYAIFYAICAETDQYGNLQNYMVDTDPREVLMEDAVSRYVSDGGGDEGPGGGEDEGPGGGEEEPGGDGILRIIKRDAGTLDLLDGAIFEVVGPNGDTIGSYSTVNGKIELTDLEPGNYTVYERVPPKWYLLSDEPARNVTVEDGKTAELTYDNEPYGELRVEKSSDTGENLAGVKIQIKHIESGKTYTGVTEASGAVQFTDLVPGAYEVREIAGIKGWQLDTESVKNVTVVAGEVSSVPFVNKELPGLRIEKYDSSNNNVLSGITFRIWKDGELMGDYRTGELGEILLTDLQPGSYLIQEVAADDEHILDGTPQQIELHAGDGIKPVVFYNAKKPGMHLIKVDANDPSKVISGAKFRIEAVDGSYGPEEFITDKNGEIDLSKLPPAAYVVTELECPGYIVDDAQRIIQLDGNEDVEFVFTNSIKPTLHLIKTSADGTPLEGVTFRIAKVEDGSHYIDRTTDKNGEINVSDLDPGVYSVVETATLPDHILDKTEYHVELFPGKTSEIRLKNDKRPNLTIYKVDADTGEVVPNTVFIIEAADGHSINEVKTGADGKATLENMLPGVYKITEKSVPSAYLKDAPSQLVTLYPNKDRAVYFKNHKKPTLTVRKVDSITGSPIKGAKFEVWYGSNNTTTGELNSLGTFFSDENGQFMLDQLRDGWYRVTELEPAPGFTIKEPATQEFYIKGGENKTITFENVPKNAIIVEKYDSVTGEALPGCTFQLRYLAGTSGTGGTVIGEKVTGKNGTAMWTGLEPGAYIVEEVDPADGYSIIQASETVFLADNGEQSVITVRFTNAPDGILLIRKVCATNPSVTLQNAEFKVMYADGTLIGDSNGIYRTDEAGEIRIPGLKPGKSVVVTEVRAPAGFILDTQSQTIQIKEGRTVSLTFKNQPKGSLIIQKRDSQTNDVLLGAEFRITTAAGCEVGLDGVIGTSTLTPNGIFTTDTQGEIRISNLAPGAYVINEIKAPNGGYVIDTPSTNVVIGTGGDTQTVVIKNTRKGGLIVEKYDSVTKQPLRGATFKITTASGELVPDNEGLTSSNGLYTTDVNGQIVLSKLLPDTYVVAEEKAPDNYRKDPTPQTVVVNTGDTQTIRFYDDPLCALTILKRDAVTKKPLAGATFTVRDSEGKAIGTNNGSYTTGSDGTVTITGLEPDSTIVVSESKASTGYILDETPKNIVVRSGVANSLIFDNEPGTTLIIRKFIEGTENEPLSGVAFKVVDGSGAAVGPDDGLYYTNKSGEIVLNGIEPGTTVIAREVKTVDGFVLDGTPQDILIKAGQVQQLTFWNKRAGTLLIEKLDSVTKAPLKGAQFKVVYADGRVVDAEGGKLSSNGIYLTDSNGQIKITGVVGTIVVTEEKAPDGYVIGSNDKSQTVVVNPDDTQTLRFYNDPLCSLTLTKKDSVTGKPVPGTEFTVKDGNGNVLGKYTTGSDGTVTVTGLIPDSTVVVVETKVPNNYVLDSTPRTIIVRNVGNSLSTGTTGSGSTNVGGGSGNNITVENVPKTQLTIEKYLETESGNELLKGVTFLVTDASGAVIGSANGEYVTDENGRIVIPNLEPGTVITAREVKVPEGVVLDTSPKSIEIKAGEGQTLKFVNKMAGTLVIKKLDKETNEPLAGVEFELTYAEGGYVDDANGHLSSKGRYTTNDTGEIRISGITGTVIVKEVKCLPGYTIDPATQEQVVVVNPADTQALTFYNNKIGGIEIIKTDEETGERISGVQFEIRKLNGEIIGNYTTDRSGVISVPQAEKGWYQVTELKAAKGYQLDSQPYQVEVKDSGIATLEITNRQVGSALIHKIDSLTGEGIYGVKFLVCDAKGNPVGTYESDNEGYVYINGELADGKYTVRELECAQGYILDTQPKTFYVEYGGCTTITWPNTAMRGQIQIVKKSADYNPTNGLPAGTPLEGAVFDIYNERTGNKVDTIVSGPNGLASSKQLPLGRYTIRESKAPVNYGVSADAYTAVLEYSGQIVKLEVSNKSLSTGVSITKTGPKEAVSGQPVRYVFPRIGNNSNVMLQSFYWRDTLPTAVRLDKVITGTYNFSGTYKIIYKTNTSGDYLTLADSLSTSQNHTLAASPAALGLASNERVTEIMFVFGQVPAGFSQVEAPMVYCTAVSDLAADSSFVNVADVGGTYNGVWVQAVSRWETKVYGKPIPLPRTGY